ncbi:DUF2891 family protein [Corynebacterium aquatimens]|nr:DUF2891 domain-containing protein [Corynebacterium aquatimens]QYH19097.1 DUF2891 family protein [Corynebacterium aquatimens]
MTGTAISDATARDWARTICAVVGREYPAAMHHVSAGPADTDCTPRALHPAFWGSFDWHSSVHMLASGVKLLAWELGEMREELLVLIGARLTPTNIFTEAAYLRDHPLYERPYGWAWALHLGKACRDMAKVEPRAAAWAEALVPLEAQIVANAAAWLRAQPMPVRHGVHDNSALALFLMHDALPAGTGSLAGTGSPGAQLRAQIEATAREWFGADRAYPFAWELSAHDFVSNGLGEAVLMQRVLEPGDFAAWEEAFWGSVVKQKLSTPRPRTCRTHATASSHTCTGWRSRAPGCCGCWARRRGRTRWWRPRAGNWAATTSWLRTG